MNRPVRAGGERRTWQGLALLIVLTPGVLSANPERREPHERFRRLRPPPPELARWFMPGELGYEPGAEPPPPGPRAYLTRTFYGIDGIDGGEWSRHNGLGPGLLFSHNLATIFPPSLYDAHPEFFAWIDGERARPRATHINWNPELGAPATADFAAAAANHYFESKPDATSFSVGINDALRYGDSPETRRWVFPPRYFRNMPVYSDLVFNFANEVAARVATRHPDKLIGALAYYWTEQAPSFPLNPQVAPFLTADRSLLFDRAFRREESALEKSWARSGAKRLGLYDYIYGYGFLVPRMHTATLARHLREARRTGFTDYFAELNTNWGLDGPQPWLAAQLLQDPEQSPRALLEEYYRRYFRRAAGPMRGFFAECETLWTGQGGPVYWLKHYRNDSQAALFPPAARRRLRALLDAAARAARGDRPVEARVALVSDAFRVSERYVEFVEARDALGRAVLAAEGRQPAALKELAIRRATDRTARQSFVATLADVRAARPSALTPAIPVDFQRSDWGPSADWLLAGGLPPPGRELLEDAGWRGPITPGLRLAGLLYEPGLTDSWQARTEPWQGLVARLLGDGTSPRTLRLENNKTSAFEQGVACPPTGSGTASWEFSGRISQTNQVFFRVLWFDATQAPCGETTVQIPSGEWQSAKPVIPLQAPNGAAYIGFAMNLLHQQVGDWLEIRNVSLTWRD
jgi:Domain of unknown function (DUF4838)